MRHRNRRAANDSAQRRLLKFFAANIRNPHTRRAYVRAVSGFLAWCDEHGVSSITAVQPLHVAASIETQTRTHAAPTVKQQLAAFANSRMTTGHAHAFGAAGSPAPFEVKGTHKPAFQRLCEPAVIS